MGIYSLLETTKDKSTAIQYFSFKDKKVHHLA